MKLKKRVKFMNNFKINRNLIGENCPTYFIADIAANHDGDLKKAIDLIYAAKDAGANAAKFQHFNAETIVSNDTFSSFKKKLSHQKKWKQSVFEVYKNASIDLSWTKILHKECKKARIDFFTSPYSIELVEHVDPYVPVYKIGSGDITWLEIIEHISKKNKPVILATGASSLKDVQRALKIIKKNNKQVCLMQCNTNYTGSNENFNYINLNVLKQYRKKFKNVILGLSDHTPGHSTVLGAITLGAKIIEKHFTLSNNSKGPDHKFSLTPKSWREMVDRSRELEMSLGNENKKIEQNELESSIVQRRSLHLTKDYRENQRLDINDTICLRPSLPGSIQPYDSSKAKFKKFVRKKYKGEVILWKDLK